MRQVLQPILANCLQLSSASMHDINSMMKPNILNDMFVLFCLFCFADDQSIEPAVSNVKLKLIKIYLFFFILIHFQDLNAKKGTQFVNYLINDTI